jgi:hypothetical protein
MSDAGSQRTSPSWTVVPTLYFVGVASSIFYWWFIVAWFLYYPAAETPLQLLAGLCFGVAMAGTLAIRGDLTIRAGAVCAVATAGLIFVVNDSHSPLRKLLTPEWHQGTLDRSVIFRALAIVLPMYVVFQWFTARGRARWVPWVGLICGVAAVAMLGYYDWEHRFAKFSTSAGYTLDDAWQRVVAGFLGLALWLQAVVAKRRASANRVPEPARSPKARVAAAVLLAVFFVGVLLASHLAIRLAWRRNRVSPGSIDALAAEYNQLAPAAANLAPVTAKPPGDVLLARAIGDWAPEQPEVTVNPVQHAQKDSWPCPCQTVTYTIEYRGEILDTVKVHITEYPDGVWAEHDLKNSEFQSIIKPSPFLKRVTVLNSDVYQVFDDFTWTSGNKIIRVEPQIDSHGKSQEILEAYVRAYPSTIH